MLKNISLLQTIGTHLKLENFFFLFPFLSFRIVQTGVLVLSYYDHHHHSPFNMLAFPHIFSIIFPPSLSLFFFIETIDNRIELKTQTSVFTSQETRRREIYSSTPSPILFIVVLFKRIAKENVCSTNCFSSSLNRWSSTHATALHSVNCNMHDTFIDLM